MDFAILERYPAVLLEAAWLTVQLSLVALAGAGVIGFAVAVIRILTRRTVNAILGVIVDLIRGTPLLVQMLVWYLGPSLVGIEIEPFQAALLCLSVNGGAFISEIIRGGLRSLPKGQREAALALGLSRIYSLRAIELPQAMPIVLPSLVSFYIGLIKDTSIAYIVGLHELMKSSQLIADYERQPMVIYLAAAVIYFVLCFPLSRIAIRMEARMRRSGIASEHLAV